jgi:hypothetical protein
MNSKDAITITGGLSHTSKMPCASYSLPAHACKTGSILRTIPGSTCARCYAADTREHASMRSTELHRGAATRYLYPNVKQALDRRLHSISHPQWVEAMVALIKESNNRYFRWHDSGDLQSVTHLANIAEVCRRTPRVKHWLPTRELNMIRQYEHDHGLLPRNLVVRISATMVNKPAPYGRLTSVVAIDQSTLPGFACSAYKQNGTCGHCRACWDKRIRTIVYLSH